MIGKRILPTTVWLRVALLLGGLLSMYQTAWALKPDRVYHQTPDSLGLTYATRVLKTADGFSINTWAYVPNATKNRHTTIILACGDAVNMGGYVYQANALSQAGYQVITFDYRGFGHSSDFAMNPNQLYYPEFAEDLRTVVKAARQQFPTQKLGVVAFSMGTIMASMVANEEKLDFLVGEGFFAKPQEVVSRLKQLKNKELVLPAEASKYAQLLPKIKCPILVFSAAADQITTLADSQELVAQKSRNRELVPYEGGHTTGFMVLSRQPVTMLTYGDLYVERITAFLHKERIQKT
jgi:predicted alpha/beta hydrolase